MSPFFILATAFVTTTIFTLFALRLFPRIGLLDRPAKYGLTRAPIPYYGGLTIVATITVLALFSLPFTREVGALFVALGLLALVAFLDDYRGVPPLVRLCVQAAAALILVVGGVGLTHIANPFGGELALTAGGFALPFVGVVYPLVALLVVGWVIALTNTVNWLDGIPGQASGLSALASFVLLLLAVRPDFHYFDQSAVIALAALVTGSAAAFTLFNLDPPKILLGDTGSMPLGFLVAAVAIFSGAKLATAALVLGLPILDAIFVIGRRLARGQSPFRGDLTHLHHRLLAAGFTKIQTFFITLTLSSLFGLAATLLSSAREKLVALVVLAGCFLVLDAWLARRGAASLRREF